MPFSCGGVGGVLERRQLVAGDLLVSPGHQIEVIRIVSKPARRARAIFASAPTGSPTLGGVLGRADEQRRRPRRPRAPDDGCERSEDATAARAGTKTHRKEAAEPMGGPAAAL